MGSEIFATLGKSLALTLALEIPFCMLFLIRGRHDIIAAKRLLYALCPHRLLRFAENRRGMTNYINRLCRYDIILITLVNLLTNPAVVLSYILLMTYTRYPEWAIVLPLELLAVAVEGLCYKYRGENIPHPFLLSLGANAFSYGTGLIIRFAF